MTDTSRPLHELLRERAAALSADPTPADGAQPSARPLDNRLRELLSEAMRYLGRYESALYVNNNPRERGERERVQKLIEDIDDALNAD